MCVIDKEEYGFCSIMVSLTTDPVTHKPTACLVSEVSENPRYPTYLTFQALSSPRNPDWLD